MNGFIFVLGIVAFIALAVLVFLGKRGYLPEPKSATKAILAVVGCALIVFSMSFTIVPSGYTGVRTTFGQISETTVPQGFNFKIPFAQEIELVNNKRIDVKISDRIWGETCPEEKIPVFSENITITYQIDKSKSAWLYANISDVDNLIASDLVSSALKSAKVTLSASDVTNRDIIEPLAAEKLQESLDEKYGEGTIKVYKLTIKNMDFEDNYNEALAAKALATQTYERQQIENKTAIEKAEADKKVAITNAEAEAEAVRISAEAQAEANEMLAESLTESVLNSKFYEKWDGKLPSVMGDGTVITDISSTN